MKFSRDPVNALTIRRVERGQIRIGEDAYDETVALTAESIVTDVAPPALEHLRARHLQALLDRQPEMLVIGTGWTHALPPRDLMFEMARRGIGLEVMDTPAACRTFNILVAEGRRPAALLIMD